MFLETYCWIISRGVSFSLPANMIRNKVIQNIALDYSTFGVIAENWKCNYMIYDCSCNFFTLVGLPLVRTILCAKIKFSTCWSFLLRSKSRSFRLKSTAKKTLEYRRPKTFYKEVLKKLWPQWGSRV